MTSRDDRHRRAAARLRALAVSLGAEVIARGGRLEGYADLTVEEREESQAAARIFWPRHWAHHRERMRQTVSEARRSDHLASTE